MSKNRNIKVGADVPTLSERKPKISENPNSYFNWKPSWNFSKCDFGHQKWSLKNSDIFTDIIPKLISFEQRKWGEIVSDKKHNHWIDCSVLSKEARDRLNELNLYYDSLFSLRLNGTLRLFGYIENGIFYIIWYDPDHEICPAHKKHT